MKSATSFLALTLTALVVGCSSSATSEPAPASDAGSDAATASDASTVDSAAPTSACAGSAYTASCHALAGTASTSSCTEYYGWDMNSAKLACPSNLGVLDTTPCDTTGTVGSCEKQITATVCGRYWYFGPGYSTDIVRQGCPAPAVFHAP